MPYYYIAVYSNYKHGHGPFIFNPCMQDTFARARTRPPWSEISNIIKNVNNGTHRRSIGHQAKRARR